MLPFIPKAFPKKEQASNKKETAERKSFIQSNWIASAITIELVFFLI